MATTNTAPDATFKVMKFDATLSPYINWDNIATTAREVGGHFTAINKADHSVEVRIFWDADAEVLNG